MAQKIEPLIFDYDFTKPKYSNVYVRIQIIEQFVNYRFLIGVNDEEVISDLVNDLGFDSSFQRVNDCYCIYSLGINATKEFTKRIKRILIKHGYEKSMKFFTERAVNLAGPNEPYMPDDNLNLVDKFCAKDVNNEVNYIYSKNN